MKPRIARHTADSWNQKYPIGMNVRYWPVLPPSKEFPPVDSTTRSAAWELGDGSPVVLLTDRPGGIHLSHLEVLP